MKKASHGQGTPAFRRIESHTNSAKAQESLSSDEKPRDKIDLEEEKVLKELEEIDSKLVQSSRLKQNQVKLPKI